MSIRAWYIYSPCTQPNSDRGGTAWAYYSPLDTAFFRYLNPDGTDKTMRVYLKNFEYYEELDDASYFCLGSVVVAGPKENLFDSGTYGQICSCHRKVYCNFDTSISVQEVLLIPISHDGNKTIEIGTQYYGEALADKKFLTGSTTYSGYPVVSPCVGINNSCEAVITVKDEVGNYTIAKNTTIYAIPRRYYTGEIKANNSIRLYNTSTAERIITITKNGTVVGTVNVAAGATGYISLGDYNPNDKLVLTSEEAKNNFFIKTDATTFTASKKVYVKTADATFTEAKAVYLKTSDTEWKQVM